MVNATTARRRVNSTGPVGKRVRGALYLHRGAIDLLGDEDRRNLDQAMKIASDADWNVARLERFAIGLLLYEDFDSRSFPHLLRSVRVDLRTHRFTEQDYRSATNPLILHRKELLVRPEDPRREAWSGLTARMESLGLFADPIRIGRLAQWNRLLATDRLDSEGRPL